MPDSGYCVVVKRLAWIALALAFIAFLGEVRTVLLFRAAAHGQTSFVKFLIATGANVNTRDLIYRETPLMNAAAEGQDEVVLWLIQKGAKIDLTSKERETALDRAAWRGQTSTARILIENGAGLERGGPLLVSIWERHLETADLLIDKGSDVNAQDAKGDTPLIHAARRGLPREFVVKLVQAGADTKYRNRQGKTPSMIAEENGHQDLEPVLRPPDRRQVLGPQ